MTGPSDEEVYVAKTFWMEVYTMAADRGYRSLETFAGWLVGGSAAGVGLLLANLDKVSPYVPAATLGLCLNRVAYALAFFMVSKFMGSLICARAGGIQAAAEVHRRWHDEELEVPSQQAMEQARLDSTPWLLRLKAGNKMDPARTARQSIWQLQIAGLAALVSIALIATAWIEIGTLL